MLKFKYFLVFGLIFIAHLVAGVFYSGYSWWLVAGGILLLLLLLALACANIRWNFFIKATNRIPLSVQQLQSGAMPVALTFDDGPHEHTPAILDILAKYNVKATFFVIGKQIPGNEAILKRIAEEGHLIGNHSYSHTGSLYARSASAIRADIAQCNRLIYDVSQQEPKLFRPPFGVTNPALAKAVTQLDMSVVGWSVRSYDTMAKDEAKLLRKIMKGIRFNDIILLHDRCPITVAILPRLIEAIQEKGMQFALPELPTRA